MQADGLQYLLCSRTLGREWEVPALRASAVLRGLPSYNHLLGTRPCRNFVSPAISATVIGGRYSCHPHFADKQTEAPRGKGNSHLQSNKYQDLGAWQKQKLIIIVSSY